MLQAFVATGFNGILATTQNAQNYFVTFILYSPSFLQVVAFLFQLLLEEVQRNEYLKDLKI
jgi:hypothetical protein